MADDLGRGAALAAEVAPAERVLAIGLDADHLIVVDGDLGAAQTHAVMAVAVDRFGHWRLLVRRLLAVWPGHYN
nr:hypothetical protein [Solimonas soli]